MGYTQKLNKIEMRLAILILQKKSWIFIMSHINKCNSDFEIGMFFSESLDDKWTLIIVQFLEDKDGISTQPTILVHR